MPWSFAMPYYGVPPGYQPNAKPAQEEKCDVPESVFKAAVKAGASHLAKDGKAIYVRRYGVWLQADWLGLSFGGWWECGELPKEAVAL